MRCPYCKTENSRVVDSRDVNNGEAIRRRRECGACKRRFTTYERIELSMPAVVKSDGSRVDYDRAKLEFSMSLALRKRPVSKEAFDNALERVEGRLFKLGLKEVPSAAIGEVVMDELRKLDEVAYIRFASVYRKFEDIEAFADAINEIRPGESPDHV